jgi:hypothetical protein
MLKRKLNGEIRVELVELADRPTGVVKWLGVSVNLLGTSTVLTVRGEGIGQT